MLIIGGVERSLFREGHKTRLIGASYYVINSTLPWSLQFYVVNILNVMEGWIEVEHKGTTRLAFPPYKGGKVKLQNRLRLCEAIRVTDYDVTQYLLQ